MQFLRRVALVLLIAGEGLAVVSVHRLGDRAPFDLPFGHVDAWVDAAPEDALAAGLRAAALLCTWWLLLVTVAYAGARVTRVPAALRASEWLTPSTIRHTVDRALAASLVVGAVTTPFSARAVARTSDPPPRSAPPPSVVVDVRDGRSLDALPTGSALPSEPAIADPAVTPTVSSVEDAATVLPVDHDQTLVPPSTVVAERGDNLWDLSAAALARATGRERAALGDDEIARYWNVVCDANRATVRSGDVNLIYPGEVLVLPSWP
jgi:nucleoid-associated protein YgaU